MKNNIKKGFTLVELLVVMTILAVLSFLAVPQFVKMQKQANEKTFESNHRMVISAINMYVAAKDGTYPGALTDLNAYIGSSSGATGTGVENGLGQKGVVFSYTKPTSTATVILKSTLSADYTVDGNVKSLAYTAR